MNVQLIELGADLTFIVKSNFVCNYKIGDNLVHTAKILKELYRLDSCLLVKPKVVFNTSLIDAALYDFFRRVRRHTKEFRYLTEDVRRKIRRIDIEKVSNLKVHIDKFRHYQLLGNTDNLYESLYFLNKLRNRIHLQNEKKVSKTDDSDAFTSERLELSERYDETAQ